MAPKFDVTAEQIPKQSHFLHSQFLEKKPRTPTRQDEDLSGRTAILTGGNVGIGLQVARILLDMGLSKLILGVRNEAGGREVAESLLAGRAAGQTVEVWKLDLLDYASVTAFGDRAAASLDARPDIVILNAAILRVKHTINPSTGHDEDVQTNYLSTVLLLLLLLRVIKDKKPAPGVVPVVPRISVTTSNLAHETKFRERNADPLLPALDALPDPKSWDFLERYGTSKLLTILFLTELLPRLPADLALVNVPTPGLCHGSQLPRDAAGTALGFGFGIFLRVVGHSVDQGARNIVFSNLLAGPDSHGTYLENGNIRPLPVITHTPEGVEIAKRLWNETMQELSFAAAEQIVEELGRK